MRFIILKECTYEQAPSLSNIYCMACAYESLFTCVCSLTDCSDRPRDAGGGGVPADDGANAPHFARPDQLCQQGLHPGEEHCLAAVCLPHQVKVSGLCILVFTCSAAEVDVMGCVPCVRVDGVVFVGISECGGKDILRFHMDTTNFNLCSYYLPTYI